MISVRAAGAADAGALAAIQEAASLAANAAVFPPERYPFPREAVRERWVEFTAGGGWARLAEAEGGEPVAFVAVAPPWLEAIYAVPAAWGTGAAAALHEEAVRELRTAGVERGRLWVLEVNARARRFYERRGWRLDGTTRLVPFPPHPLDVGYELVL